VSSHAFAVVGAANEDTMIPYLQTAHIAYINSGIGGLAWTSPVSFIIDDLNFTSDVGIPALFKNAGCTSFDQVVGIAQLETPLASAAANKFLAASAKQNGITFKGLIFAPPTAPDMAPYATEAVSKGVDCVMAQSIGAQEISLLQALVPDTSLKKIGFGISYLNQPAQIAAADPIMAKLGSRVIIDTATEGSNMASTNPMLAQWVKDQTTYAPKTNVLESGGALAWADLQLAIKAATAVYPNVTGANVLANLNTTHNFWPGVVPPVSFDTPAPPNPLGPRVQAVWIAPTKWTGGKLFPRTGPFVNAITGKTDNNTGS
jgi:hypothetical protein